MKMRCCSIFLFALLWISTNSVYAQHRDEYHSDYKIFIDPWKRGRLDYILGYQTVNKNTFEVGLALGHRGFEGGALFYGNYHLTTEHNFSTGQYIMGTKVGYKLSFYVVDVTTQIIYYTNFNEGQPAFRPEIGLTLAGGLDLNYGYTLMKNSGALQAMQGHLLALRLTLGRGVKGVF